MGVQWTPMRANGDGGLNCSQAGAVRDAASALPLCPMVGWVPLRSCSRGTVGADFGSHFGCELEGVDSYPGETLSCGWVLDARVPVVPGCKGGLRSVEEWYDLTIFSGNRKIWYFGHRLKTVQRRAFWPAGLQDGEFIPVLERRRTCGVSQETPNVRLCFFAGASNACSGVIRQSLAIFCGQYNT